jgi:hypothetical protein
MVVLVYHKTKSIPLSFIFSPQSRTQQLIARYFVGYYPDITVKYGISSDTVRY